MSQKDITHYTFCTHIYLLEKKIRLFYRKKNKGKHKTPNLKSLFKKTSIISLDSITIKLINKTLKKKARKR